MNTPTPMSSTARTKRKPSTAEALAAADRVLGNHTYAAVFGDDGSPPVTAPDSAAAEDAQTLYQRVWPSSTEAPRDPIYAAVFGKD